MPDATVDNILFASDIPQSNGGVVVVSSPSSPPLQIVKPYYGTRAWTFSHNFCDKTTWYGDAIRVVDEAVGTGDGVITVFNLAHNSIIDMNHGKITDENDLAPTASQGGTSYIPVVKIDGVTKTERAFCAASGGDYTVNYATGAITFFVAPTLAAAITATYFYSPVNSGSTMYIKPASGQKTIITTAECLFSINTELTDSLISAIFTYNPALGAPPAKFEYPGSRTTFKRFADFVNFTNGSFPVMPAMGGATRGFASDIYQLRFDYITAITLDDAYGSEIRVWLENHTPYGGETGIITFYGYS